MTKHAMPAEDTQSKERPYGQHLPVWDLVCTSV